MKNIFIMRIVTSLKSHSLFFLLFAIFSFSAPNGSTQDSFPSFFYGPKQTLLHAKSIEKLNQLLTQHAHSTSLPLFIILTDSENFDALKTELTQGFESLALENSSYLFIHLQKRILQYDENIKISSLQEATRDASEELKKSLKGTPEELRTQLHHFITTFFEATESPVFLNEESFLTLDPQQLHESESNTLDVAPILTEEPAQFRFKQSWVVYSILSLGCFFCLIIFILRIATFIYISESTLHPFYHSHLALTLLLSKKQDPLEKKEDPYEKIVTSHAHTSFHN